MSHEGVSPGTALQISDVQIRFVADGRDGLVGWVSCVIGGAIKLNNVALRRGRRHELFLTFPAKISPCGERRFHFHPISTEAAALLERGILAEVRELLGPASPRARTGAGGPNG